MSSSDSLRVARDGTVPLRPAASLLVVRESKDGVEVLALRRSKNMRFLPDHLAFPGGALEAGDEEIANAEFQGELVAQVEPRDAVYAVAAVRECAEETGLLCAVGRLNNQHIEDRALQSTKHTRLLEGQERLIDILREENQKIIGSSLRFVGRWITPSTMPMRFDTRFFLHVWNGPDIHPLNHDPENQWSRWVSVVRLLTDIEAGKEKAMPPTLAMLTALYMAHSVNHCFANLVVPGPGFDMN